MMRKLVLFALSLMGAAMILGGCVGVGGTHRATGDVISRTFDVGDFNAISIGGSREIIFRQSENSSVTIEMRESLFDITQVYVRSNTLHVYTRGSVTNPGTQRVYVYAPTLQAASISGSSNAADWDVVSIGSFSLTASGSANIAIPLDVENLTVNASGSGRVELSGRADNADITRSGSGSVLAFDLQTQNASVARSGSSRVEISVSDSLNVVSSGSGSVRYRGNPGSVNTSVSGSSTVSRVD